MAKLSKPVVIVGALDTKGEEFRFVRDLIAARKLETVLVDFGVMGDPPLAPDIPAETVAKAGGHSLAELRAGGDKTLAMETMAAGLERVVKDLHAQGRLGGILGMAGSGGTAIATRAMRALPIGVPKVMASTVAGGDVSAFVGTVDITMMPTIVDVAGINSISRHDLRQRRQRDRRHGERRAARAERNQAADHRQHVRQHDRVRDTGAARAGGTGLRGARLPRHGHRRPDDGVADRLGLYHGEP